MDLNIYLKCSFIIMEIYIKNIRLFFEQFLF